MLKDIKIETFVLKNSWVFVKISTDAGITGWGEMLKDDAKACAAGALEVADYLGRSSTTGKPSTVVPSIAAAPSKPRSPPALIWPFGISPQNAMACPSSNFWAAPRAIGLASTARSAMKPASTP
jgi:hypothetical protein